MQSISDNPLVILLLINVILLVLGTFMDMAPLIIICTPIFLPVVKAIGIDPVHFGVILILNAGIGLNTPPVGSVLFVACAIGKVSISESDADDLAVLRRERCRAAAGHLCPRLLPLAAERVPLTRLSDQALAARCPPAVRRPAYDRARAAVPASSISGSAPSPAPISASIPRTRWSADFGPWGVIGASLQRPDQRDRLAPQDGLYTFLKRAPAGAGAAADRLRARRRWSRRRIRPRWSPAWPRRQTRIVSLTVTEKGYCHDPATGRLRADHPDIVHDLANPDRPALGRRPDRRRR